MGKKLNNYLESSEAAATPSTDAPSDSYVCIYDINREQDYDKNSGGILDENELRPPSQLHSLLEKNKTGFISEEIFETVSLSSDSVFQRAVSILHTSYLDSASEHGFQYSQVTLVKNDIFLNEYKTFYQQKKASNYTQEELQETYGFLLFETENQAKLVCQRGLCVGSSTVTTLGDPAKGVYISRYSDYLHPRPWYHGKSGYVVIFNLIKGKVKFVPENYTTNYTGPSSGYDCHVATNINRVSPKTSHFRAFELSQYYVYELSDNTVIERPRQVCPSIIVAFQYKEPKTMATPKSILELHENVLVSPWKGKLIIQGCLLCDITLCSTYGTVIPRQLPLELDFKYVIKVSSLKKRLPEDAFKKPSYLEPKVCHQDICSNLYEVELSNKQGEKVDKLTEYIKNEELAIVKCLEDRGVFILLTSSSLISDTGFESEQASLHGLHLFHSPLSAGMKDLKVEDGISSKVTPILPILNCALMEAKKSFTEEGIRPNTLIKQNFQELYKGYRSPSLTADSQDGTKEMAFFGQVSNGFDSVSPAEKCPMQSLTQLQSYFSDPSGYILEVSTALDLLAEHPESPCVSDGICDAGFSLVMTPDPEFLDSESEVRKETETEKNPEEILKSGKRSMIPLSAAANLRVQPKRKATMPLMIQNKRINLCRPFPKRTAATNSGSDSTLTLKLAKGQFPQKRKRGAEVLTAQFVQTTKLDRKNQEASISKDVQVTANTKRARKREKSPVKTVPKPKPSGKKSPQKQRLNIIKDNQNPRIRKQPQPAKGETASQLQSEILPDSQENAVSISTAPSENTIVDQKDFRENSVAHCDSQALNMLADLALSSATSSTPSSEPRNFPCTSEFSQNDVLLSEENSVPGASDHEYHRGIKSQKGELLPKLSTDRKTNSVADLTGTEDEDSLVPCSQAPFKAQSTLIEDTRETSDVSHSSCVAVEHSYALLFAEHSNRHLQQRGLQGPAFAQNGTKGPEAGTPVGKVMPFRHQQNISPLQKVFEPFVKRKNRLMSSSLKDFYCSHTVFSCDGSFKVTFKCEPEYVFSLDSKYTNNPLEKTVVRALHGPWNTDLPDNVEEVKLLLHMWVALFYSNQNKVIRSTRKVVEHSNPAKFVSINSTIDSFELNEIEESCSMERCSPDPLLENKETSRGQAAEMSFPDTDALLPVIKLPPARALDLCVQNKQKEVFVGEGYHDNSGSQNFIWSCNNKVIERKAEQEESDQLETCSAVLSSNGSIETNGPSMPDEDQTFQPLNSTKMTSHNDAVTQTAFTKACDGINSQSVTCENPVYDTLESKDDVFPATMQGKTEIVQDLNQHVSPINKECQPSLESKDDNMGYVMINLEPVALTFEKNTCVPIQTEVVNRSDKPTTFNMELIKQVSPDTSLSQPVSEFEKAQTQGLHDISTLAASEPKGNEYLCASSVSRKTLAKEICSLQEDSPLPVSLSSSDNSVVKEVVSLVKNSSYPLPSEEMQLSQDSFLQTQNPFTVSLGDAVELTRFEEEVERNYPLNCISPKRIISDDSVELRKNDNSCLNSESVSFESFNSAFTKHTSLSMNREEVSLELSEEDSDIDLTLTISPPTSPREQIPADEIEQLQEDPLSSLEFQDVTEEIIESGEVTVMGDREVNSTAYVSLSEEPLEDKERKGDDFQPVTVVLSKDSSTFEISGKVNVTSDFPFDSLIEEVSPASSPDPLVPAEEIQPSPAIFPCSLNLHDVQCKKSNVSSQIESVDFAVTEKENSFVDPSHPFGQDDLTQVQGIQHYAEMPLLLSGHQEGKDKHLTLCGKVTEEIVQSEHDRVLSFPEKQQCCDAELNQPAADTLREHDSKPSLGKLVKPESPLQSGNIENRNLNTEHLTLETSEPPFNPRKIIESESSAGVFVSTAASDGIVSVPLKQPTSPKSIKKNVFSNDLKTNEGTYLQVKSLNSGSVDGAVITQAYTPSEIPKLGPSDSVTGAINVETEYQTQEISVVRMASLLKDSETKAELNKETIDVSLQSDISRKGEQTIPMLQDTSVCETKDLSNGGFLPICTDSNQITPDTSEKKEPPASFVPNSFGSLICEASKEYMDNKSARERLPARDGSETLDRDLDVSVKPDVHYEPLSDNSDRDSLGDYRNPKLDMEDSCTLRCSHNRKREDATKDDYNSFMSVNNSDSEDWDYSKEPPELETSMPPRSQSSGLKKEDKCVPRFIQIKDLHGIPRVYTNFTVTREFKDSTLTLPRLRRHPSFTEKCGLISSWTRTWQIADDLTQNTLDLEYLRFAHKLKQLVKSRGSQHCASSTSAFPKESPIQIAVGAVPFTELSESSVLHPASRSRSPLLVTVVHSDPRQPSPHMRSHVPSSLDSSFFWKEKCSHNRHHLPDSEGSQTASFHLNKLQYTGALNESRNDISLILNEYAAFNKVMNGNQEVFQGKELSVASGEATSQEIHSSLQRKPVTYEDMITDLCANLHVKLKSVMKETCKRTFFFYLVETEDKSFFLKTKNILRKSGHTEMEPQHFLKAFHRESDILIVILRNEDIASHLHQIPSLLKLKHLPSVVFAGVDSPEDVLDCTYQELFRTGGFVVSDDKILETLTLVQLKEIVKILENLNGNGNGKWKWLLHYRENKKLKEDIRVDSVAHKKNLVMKSCQSANIIELLHYHYCDSPSSTKAEHLKCLLNLQIQRIDARFAVFLTDKLTVAREVIENSGILVTDINNFIDNIQKVAAPFRSSYW